LSEFIAQDRGKERDREGYREEKEREERISELEWFRKKGIDIELYSERKMNE
jgi:hypothetical protein